MYLRLIDNFFVLRKMLSNSMVLKNKNDLICDVKKSNN